MTWHTLPPILAHGTLLTLACHRQQLWLGGPAGLFRLTDDQFHPVAHEIPFWGINAIAPAGNSLLVAGLPHGLIRSSDDGQSWLRSTVLHTERPFTCLAPSPNIHSDGVVLGGTAGDGILRSRDGGRYWELVNFGLHDFDLLALACAPAWGRREIAVAATTQAVYQSPNGGRAWRQADLPAHITVQALAFSPNFAQDGTIFAGTEQNGLLLSLDQGLSWQQTDCLPSNRSITWLGQQGSRLLAASSDGELFVSDNNGNSWHGQPISQHPILAMTSNGEQQWAGLAEAGLTTNKNGRWQPIPHVTARRFSQLRCHNGLWVAAAPLDGVFVSHNSGQGWQQLAPATPQAQIGGLALTDTGLGFVRGHQLIWNGAQVAEVAQASCLAGDKTAVYAATHHGQLWQNRPQTTDDGQNQTPPPSSVVGRPSSNWEPLPVPWRNTPILALAVQGEWLLAVVQERGGTAVSVYLRHHNTWQSLGSQNSYGQPPRAALHVNGGTVQVALGLGGLCWLGENGRWTPHKVGSAAAPITAIHSHLGSFLAVTFDGLHQFDGATWHTHPTPPHTVLVDAQHHNGRLLALTLEGRIVVGQDFA